VLSAAGGWVSGFPEVGCLASLKITCDNFMQGLSELCRDCVALRELVMTWHRLTPDVTAAIMELVRTCQA
jgi:hypothetical protein